MKLMIDLVADAAAFVWGERAKGASTTPEVPAAGCAWVHGPRIRPRSGSGSPGWRTCWPRTIRSPLLSRAGSRRRCPRARPVVDAGQPMITVREAAQIIGRERSWITRQLHAGALRGRQIGNEWWGPATGPWSTGAPAPPPTRTRPRATERRHHSPTDAALSHRAPSRPPVMGIIGALRGSPRNGHNDRGELTIHGGRAAWFACSTLAAMLPGRSRHAAEGRRSAPPTGHGRCCPVTVPIAVCEPAALMRTGARWSA